MIVNNFKTYNNMNQVAIRLGTPAHTVFDGYHRVKLDFPNDSSWIAQLDLDMISSPHVRIRSPNLLKFEQTMLAAGFSQDYINNMCRRTTKVELETVLVESEICTDTACEIDHTETKKLVITLDFTFDLLEDFNKFLLQVQR
ncbi:hypothetical protein [Vibrio harveyi]|uniref:hypothetical protein n=1 Tax=Vibrio harveyi TaxID=669 RepID=UPI003CFABF9D